MKPRHLLLLCAAMISAAPFALAHPGHETAGGLLSGWIHPFSGLDHLLAMIAVGLLAGHRGGRSLWMLPATFLACMIAGGLLFFVGVPVPFVQSGILTSVLVLGVCVAMVTNVPPSALVVLPGLFAVCHGYAHVAEMSAGSSPLLYAAGFVLATLSLHLTGIGIGWTARKLAPPAVFRYAGFAIAACGALMFAHVL
jgi:urease accessory protein